MIKSQSDLPFWFPPNPLPDFGASRTRTCSARRPGGPTGKVGPLASRAYLRALLDRYGTPGFLAAYNAGPARWEAHLATGAKLPAETKAYLARLLPIIDGDDPEADLVAASTQSWSTAPLFPAVSLTPSIARVNAPAIEQKIGDKTAFAPHENGLFVTASVRKLGP